MAPTFVDEHSHECGGSNGGKYSRWAFWGFLLIAGYFLYSEHRAHIIPYLPFLLVLACPLMHLFHGHGRHGGRSAQGDTRERNPAP